MIRLLAIDTAGDTAGAAVVVAGEVRSEVVEASTTQHSSRLFRLVDAALEGARVRKGELTHVGVTVGPGSFTGLRIGLTTAKGIAHALGLPVAAVSSLRALAWGIKPFPGTVASVLDARKRQVYGAAWDGLSGEERVAEGAWDPSSFSDRLCCVGGPLVMVGSGLRAYGELFRSAQGRALLEIPASRWLISPRQVALLAHEEVEAGRAVEPGTLSPVYHRLSEAEERKNAG